MSKDLSIQYRFLEIAQVYRSARQYKKAREWAERGLKLNSQHPDGRLRIFLAEEYQRAKQHEDAVTLVWQEFEDRPGLERFKLLKVHAEHAGKWPVWRDKALALFRDAKHLRGVERDRSSLVEVFLWEKNMDGAWAEAKAGGCSDSLWLQLAEARAKSHPSEAADVYLARVEPTLIVQEIHPTKKRYGFSARRSRSCSRPVEEPISPKR